MKHEIKGTLEIKKKKVWNYRKIVVGSCAWPQGPFESKLPFKEDNIPYKEALCILYYIHGLPRVFMRIIHTYTNIYCESSCTKASDHPIGKRQWRGAFYDKKRERNLHFKTILLDVDLNFIHNYINTQNVPIPYSRIHFLKRGRNEFYFSKKAN